MALLGEMRVSVEGFDPIEREIARAIAKGMAEDGLDPEKAGRLGEYVGVAIVAYRGRLKAAAAMPAMAVLPAS